MNPGVAGPSSRSRSSFSVPEPRGHGQKVFDKACIARAGQLQLFRPAALGFVGLDAAAASTRRAQGFLVSICSTGGP